MNKNEPLEKIGERLDKSADEHRTLTDGFWYNALTVLSLLLSTFSSIAASHSGLAVWVSIASALAALCIAVERALGLGARWRFHAEMKSAYRTLRDGINFVVA